MNERDRQPENAGVYTYNPKDDSPVSTPGDASCWQCDKPLGTQPDRCLTCAAKVAEDRARAGR